MNSGDSEFVGRSDRQTRSGGHTPDESELADVVIARLVRRGVVVHEDLVAADVSDTEIQRRRRNKRLHSLWRGVYLVGHADPPPFALEYAALRFAGESAALSDRPAAAMWGLLPKQIDPTIHLSLKGKRESPDGLRSHTRDLHPQEVTNIHGDLRITTPERTILDIAPTLDDDQLERVIAKAIRERITTERKLQQQLERRKGARGSKRIKATLGTGPELTASQAEQLFLRMLRHAELHEGAELNKRMGRRTPNVVWRRQRVIVEIDSWRWHGTRASFESDTDRHARWIAQGWTVLRFTPRQLREQPLLVIARLASAIAPRRLSTA